ncbi:MAG: hypothetical protein VCD34_10925 [Planctomycetota bacterium]
MRRIIAFALVLNASLLVLAVHELVAIAGGEPEATFNGDINGDSRLNIADPVYLLNFLFTAGPEPVAIAAGPDHTEEIAQLQAGLNALRAEVAAGAVELEVAIAANAAAMAAIRGLEQEEEAVLSHLSVVQLPVDDQGGTARTIRLSGANLQVVNGSGETEGDGGGLGNLIVGYQEPRENGNDRTGSHNLVVGRRNNYSSWGAQVVGSSNTASGLLASVCGGEGNTASGDFSVVGGGVSNIAEGPGSLVGGGRGNAALGIDSVVSGGRENRAEGFICAVGGGGNNTASNQFSVIGGGERNESSADHATIAGGRSNRAIGVQSTVGGGTQNSAAGTAAVVGGGGVNTADGFVSVVSGGFGNVARGIDSSVRGGRDNSTSDGEHVP